MKTDNKNITYITRTFNEDKEELTNKQIRQIQRVIDLYNTMTISDDAWFDYYHEDQIRIRLDANWTHELDKVSSLIDTLNTFGSFKRG